MHQRLGITPHAFHSAGASKGIAISGSPRVPAAMGRDYYGILGVPRDAGADDIRKAYRKAALRWHPDKNQERKEEAEAKFKDIAEAYDVLSDPEKRQIYDQFGEEGLKGGAQGADGATAGAPGGARGPAGFSYHFSGDPNDMFARFFKDSFQRSESFGESPFDGFGGLFGGFPGGAAGAMPGGERRARPAVFELPCSLEELYNGTTKKMKVTRASTTLKRPSETVLEISVKPGWKAGTKVTFPGEGDEIGNTGAAQDVVFVIREKRHPLYSREGSNLLHHRKVPLVDALCGFKFELDHLEPGKTLRVTVNDMVTPTYTKVIRGKGMPSSKDPNVRGDLVVTFDIVYPQKVSAETRDQLRNILPRS